MLLRTLAEAHRWTAALRAGTPLSQIAKNTGHHDSFIRTGAALAFLSPRLQVAIRDGTLPPELTLRQILRMKIPLDWRKQEDLFGV